jgi:Arc/MetJ-type ribon-helix-helix transcriptional regulator
MKRINVYITDEQHRAIKKAAHNKGLKFSEVLRRALGDWLETVNDKETGNERQEL